ncbi:uncharacterized protein BT62DRAFT_77863 [Guyanagaster necrorhizus]|uniref:DUF7598 domain-containing protein n=1 Tax=Guyanagaster necrorhizus TaxID=856835 RepID=A0A9P7VV02_9AGAR|nr:uncharacterized protein BT62DRAFT_77863 [Guyanagaster necrorhizus MCA 3950]KAG7447362.1 hypothetical protein BT62DRAFT_77863 [Guyanagaster necrorhizus MCA 3950]
MLPPRAYIFIGLNIIRTLSIIGLLLVFASNIETLVNDVKAVNRYQSTSSDRTSSSNSTVVDTDYIDGSTVPNQAAGIFWAVLNRLLIIGQTVVLLFSEFGWPSVFFNRFFPVLGDDFGLGALGIIQCLIGAAVLSHHVDDFTLVSAFFLFSIGCLNMLAGLIFRQSAKTKRSVTSWRDHAKSAATSVLPTHVAGIPVPTSVPSFVSNAFSHNTNEEKRSEDSKAGFGFGRQGEKVAGLKGFLISKPLESLPRYAAKPANSG